MTHSEGQMLIALSRALRCHAEIISGAYKLVDRVRYIKGIEIQLTDDEKLKDKIGEMKRHQNFAQDCLDFIPPQKKSLEIGDILESHHKIAPCGCVHHAEEGRACEHDVALNNR